MLNSVNDVASSSQENKNYFVLDELLSKVSAIYSNTFVA